MHVVDISRKGAPPRLLTALSAHRAPVLGVAWSEDESRLASCDKKGVVAVWDGGQQLAEEERLHEGRSDREEAASAVPAAAAAQAGEAAAA